MKQLALLKLPSKQWFGSVAFYPVDPNPLDTDPTGILKNSDGNPDPL